MRALCRRRHETISNLATEFGVSTRTILRDIAELSVTEPIYTRCGKYGGVYIIDDYSMSKMYMNDNELSVLQKLSRFAENGSACCLSEVENKILKVIISQYTKPKNIKENTYDKKRKRTI